MDTIKGLGLGWRRDLPDYRDYTPESSSVQQIAAQSDALGRAKAEAPSSINLCLGCSEVEFQDSLSSCTANAAVGLMEYFEKRTTGEYLDGSRLFVYKVTRNLLGWKGDQGAYLRTAMQCLVLFGLPPESYWPYDLTKFDEEPPAFCYAFAQSYKTRQYFRHDPPGVSPKDVLASVRTYLAGNLPCMFGFSVYSSIPGTGQGTGDIPFPSSHDHMEGGHAVMAVGYDDAKKIGEETGALLIRNSWGKQWGEDGYGWLPYAYVERGLAADFWSLIDAAFINTELFA